MQIRLRHAVAEDAEFLYRVYASTREVELAPLNWTEKQRDAFLRMQFAAQSRSYMAHYPNAAHHVILKDGHPIGRFLVDRSNAVFCLIDIALRPEHRNCGIGSMLIKELTAEAQAAGKPIQLHVEKFNPALRFYRRLGFVQIADNGIYLQMQWSGAERARS